MTRNPEKVSDVLALAQKMLDVADPRDAVELIHRFGAKTSELSNIYGVALMRAGDPGKAVEVYRGLCLSGGGFCLKQNLPTAFLANYATALLLTKNVSGCLAVLRQLAHKDDPYVSKLHAAIRRWRRSLGWWKRISLDWYGAEPDSAVPLDFPPGEITVDAPVRPAA